MSLGAQGPQNSEGDIQVRRDASQIAAGFPDEINEHRVRHAVPHAGLP